MKARHGAGLLFISELIVAAVSSKGATHLGAAPEVTLCCGGAYSRSDRFQLMRSPSVVLLDEEEEEDEPEEPFGDFSRSL